MKCVIFIDCNQGKVKWGLGEEDKEYGTAGKLDIPNFGDDEQQNSLRNVGKLKLPANLEVIFVLSLFIIPYHGLSSLNMMYHVLSLFIMP